MSMLQRIQSRAPKGNEKITVLRLNEQLFNIFVADKLKGLKEMNGHEDLVEELLKLAGLCIKFAEQADIEGTELYELKRAMQRQQCNLNT